MPEGASMHGDMDMDSPQTSVGMKSNSSGGVGASSGGGSNKGRAAARFGTPLTAQVTFPSHGTYALVGQLRRASGELILAPFYIACQG